MPPQAHARQFLSRRPPLLPLLLLALFVAAGWAQKPVVPTIRITVTVTNPKGDPVPGAGVVLKQSSVASGRMPRHPFHVELHTDEKGTATVQGFEPGQVLVQVIAKGFQTYGQGFIMEHADENVHVQLRPPRSQVTIYKNGGGGA